MNEIEKLNMIAEWQEQHKQLIEDLDNSKKRIEELEKDKAYTEGQLDEQIQATLKLQKENAELKAFRQDCVKLTEDNVVIVRQRAETSKQLTKATELLRKLVLEVTGYEEIYGYDTCEPVQEAEQFLKDSEVEK